MGSSFSNCWMASRPQGQRAGSRLLEAKRGKRWRERPVFQGRVDSGCEKKEETKGIIAAVAKAPAYVDQQIQVQL